jgi:hypothetical protein
MRKTPPLERITPEERNTPGKCVKHETHPWRENPRENTYILVYWGRDFRRVQGMTTGGTNESWGMGKSGVSILPHKTGRCLLEQK